MLNEYWLFLVSLLVITFLSRWWPRIACPMAAEQDACYHMLQAENIRKHRFLLPKHNSRFVLAGRYEYPPIYHYLLALFSRRWRERFERVSSAIFDTAHVAVFWFLTSRVSTLNEWNLRNLFLLSLVFALNPAFVGLSTGPRAYQGTARTLGELMFTFTFIALWISTTSGNWILYVLGAFLGAVMLNTSKFSGQALLFICSLMAILLNSIAILLFPALCVICALIITNGHYRRVLYAQVSFLHLYAIRIADQHHMVSTRKKLVFPRSLREAVRLVMFGNVWIVAITRFTLVVFTFFAIVWNAFMTTFTVDLFLESWLVAAVLVFLLVAQPVFAFIGEADRYLEYALVPGVLLFGIITTAWFGMTFVVLAVILFALLYVLYSFLFVVQHSRPHFVNKFNLFEFLSQQKPGVILSLLGDEPYELAYRTPHQICYFESPTASNISSSEFDKFYWRYPLPAPNFSYFIEKYGLSLVVASKKVLQTAQSQGCSYSFMGFEKIYENETHVVYHVASSAAADRRVECVPNHNAIVDSQ